MEKKLYSIKGRLGLVRKKRRLTQEEFAIMMDVNPKTVKNWEQGLVNPSLETMMEICNQLDCDLDFLAGRIDGTTHDKTFICEQLGLPEEVIDKIVTWKRFRFLNEPLISLLESDDFPALLRAYHTFMHLVEGLKEMDYDSSDFRTRADGKIIISREGAVQHFKGQVTGILSGILEKAYQEKIKKLPEAEDGEWSIESEIKATRQDLAELEEALKQWEDEQEELRVEGDGIGITDVDWMQTRHLDEDEKGVISTDTPGGDQELLIE